MYFIYLFIHSFIYFNIVFMYYLFNVCMYVCMYLLFRATPTAYLSSRARGQIGAAADSLHHSSGQHQIPDPFSKAMDTSWIHFRYTTTGTPSSFLIVLPLSILGEIPLSVFDLVF